MLWQSFASSAPSFRVWTRHVSLLGAAVLSADMAMLMDLMERGVAEAKMIKCWLKAVFASSSALSKVKLEIGLRSVAEGKR